MKAEYNEVWRENGVVIPISKKVVYLPFERISVRAIIIRKKDGAILGTLHKEGGTYALPGGAIENGENSAEAVLRELEEENIVLINKDLEWENHFTVDYFDGYRELSIWYIFTVKDAEIGECEENIETRWIAQDEDVWHPSMRENIILSINRVFPEYSRKTLKIVNSIGNF